MRSRFDMTNLALQCVISTAVGLAACGMVQVGGPASESAAPVTLDGPRAATALRSEDRCSETDLRKPLAVLRWTTASTPGREQRVDVATRADGFAVGDFRSSATLGPAVSTLTWDRVDAGIIHYWRVVTVHADAQVSSEVADFKGAVCIADFQPTQSPALIATPSARPTAAVASTAPPSGAMPSPPASIVPTESGVGARATESDAPGPALVDSAQLEGLVLIGAVVGVTALLALAWWWLRR
jgi:hypothetical protein